MDKGVAVLFILCEARTEYVYNSIWKEITRLIPNLQNNLRFIMMDYERTSMNAVHKQFSQASLRGCWFHYCQAVLKKWKRLGLLTAPHNIVSMAMALPLAPQEMFSEGLSLMQRIADKESDNYPNILLFMKYMRRTWLLISEKVSVYGYPIRTNNLVESFHNIMAQKMQTIHPNLWIFLDNISKLITNQEINYDRLVNGLQITKGRSQSNKYRNTKIREAQNYLSSGIYSLEEFLQIFDKEMSYQQMSLLVDDNNEDEEISADLHTGGAVNAASTSEMSPHRKRHHRRSHRRENEKKSNNIEDNNNENEDIYANLHTREAVDTASTSKMSPQEKKSRDKQESNLNVEVEAESKEKVDENVHDNEEHIYEVPEDDYGYWFNEDSLEEETIFFPVNNVNLIASESTYQELTCIICFTEKSNITFIPCGHLCCCKSCLQKLMHKRCPTCNDIYEEYISTGGSR